MRAARATSVLAMDVTSACKSPMNTGVQRMVRGLYQALSETGQVVPLCWDKYWRCYCRLTPREWRFLTTPFAQPRHRIPTAHPERLASPHPAYVWWRTLRHGLNRWKDTAQLFLVPEIFADARAVFWLSRPFAPNAAILHDALVWSSPHLMPVKRQKHFPAYLKALARFRLVLCVSEEARCELLAFWQAAEIPAAPTRVLPWPVPWAGERPPESPPASRRRVLTVATLEPRKNLEVFLEAAEIVWSSGLDWEWRLVGRSVRGSSEKTIERIEALRGRGRPLVWLGHLADEALQEEYRRCAFTVFPSLREGFGLPILESVWHGRPCLCADSGAIAETAVGGGCLIGPVGDPVWLADNLRRLLLDDQLYAALTQQAWRRTFTRWPDYLAGMQVMLTTIGLPCLHLRNFNKEP